LVDVDEDQAAATMRRAIVLFKRQPDSYRRSDELHILRVFRVADIMRALSAAGMSYAASDSYGGFKLGPRRMAFLARPW
jgi:hypothetical protein